MRKLFLIFLLGIFAFNWFGYRIVISWIEELGHTQMELAFDQNKYDTTGEIVLKVALPALSYYSPQFDYTRQDGQVTIDGIAYKFVKIRVLDDSVELVCVPDQVSKTAAALVTRFVHLNLDNSQNASDKKSNPGLSIFKIMQADFDEHAHLVLLNPPDKTTIQGALSCIHIFASGYLSIIENPPEKI